MRWPLALLLTFPSRVYCRDLSIFLLVSFYQAHAQFASLKAEPPLVLMWRWCAGVAASAVRQVRRRAGPRSPSSRGCWAIFGPPVLFWTPQHGSPELKIVATTQCTTIIILTGSKIDRVSKNSL